MKVIQVFAEDVAHNYKKKKTRQACLNLPALSKYERNEDKYMKKILYFSLVTMLVICVSGCAKEDKKINDDSNNIISKEDIKINNDSKLVLAKNNMTEKLNNYAYDVEMITKTGFMDITTNMSCKEDLKNKVSYSLTSTYGVETEEYVDYKNKMTYSKVNAEFGDESSNGKWISEKYKGGDVNNWISLTDAMFNITEEKKDGGTYYKGTVDSQKINETMSQLNSNDDKTNMISNDIDISVFVNSSNYIEKISFVLKIMGIEEEVEITYKEFNTSGDIVIPDEAKRK